MKKRVSLLCAAVIALSSIGMTAAPVLAAPASLSKVDAGTNLIEVQNRRGHQNFRNNNRRPQQRYRGYERRGGNHYYNGHRGYSKARPGYRNHNGWWFPPAAFITGAIIGGAISGNVAPSVPQYHGRLPTAHVNWCHQQYKSYRVSDNSFQPYNGPRRQCRSPYY